MIIAYDKCGREVGRYDTATDLYYDYPTAYYCGGKYIVEEV